MRRDDCLKMLALLDAATCEVKAAQVELIGLEKKRKNGHCHANGVKIKNEKETGDKEVNGVGKRIFT
tara:strand:- start:391 stop:591 length:201 start_codon:yes stop_codon:yes gene_type:complete